MTPKTSIAPKSLNYHEAVTHLPDDSTLQIHNVSWESYEDLLAQLTEPRSLHISYNNGTLTAMTVSAEHEKYVAFINSLISQLRFRLRLNILCFGGPTIKVSSVLKGNEPDACFYVQSAEKIGTRIRLDFETDPPPDIAVEVDIHHLSLDNFSIYAALGVIEIWRFDGQSLSIHLLQDDSYAESESSLALPMLSGEALSKFLAQMRDEGELDSILAFDEWLQSLPK